jgi:hypothetical protein
MEKPKITHKMVRRMSFMKSSFRSWKMSKGSKMQAVQAEQGLNRPHTKGDNGPNGAASSSCHALHHAVTELRWHTPNTLAQTGMQNPAKD